MSKAVKLSGAIIAIIILLPLLVACKAEYSLRVDIGGGQGVVAPSSGKYAEGTTVTIAAIPDSGWEFDRWDGDTSGDENPTTVRISRDKIIRAYFVEIQVPTPTPTPTATPTSTPSPTSAPTPTPTSAPTPTPTSMPTPTSSKLITVTYSSSIASHIDGTYGAVYPERAGDVFLIVNMSIHNQGYDSFSVGPGYFSVIVNSIEYDESAYTYSLDNYLQSVGVLGGGLMTGSIAYEIPEGATTFLIQYGGYGTYNIQWIPLGQSAPSTPTPTPASSKLITVTYSSSIASHIDGTYGAVYPERAGDVFLIVNMSIHNQGYDSFSVGPGYFSVIVNSIEYDESAYTYSLDNYLQSVDVLGGGLMTGSIAYEIPEGATTFLIQYGGYGTYNIQWVPQ